MPVSPLVALITLLSFLPSSRSDTPNISFRRRSNTLSNGYFSPLNGNGSMLTFGWVTFPPGLGEPLNAIISSNSDPDVLKDQQDGGGLRNFFLSLSFSSECLGQHLGSNQMADLGDGHGAKIETAVIRYDYGDSALGSCQESVEGGNHFRYWVQDGPKAKSGAVFLAVSYEKPIKDGHDIIYNGYNLGRDWLIGNITGSAIPTRGLTNTSTYQGTTQSGGYTYQTSVAYTSGLLHNASDGVNHFASVGGGPDNITAIDGLVAVLTVKITDRPKTSAALPFWSSCLIPKSALLAIFLLFLTTVL